MTPPEAAAGISTLLWHGRAKTARPCVPGSRRLDALAGVTLDARDADLRPGPPDLERLEW